MVTRKKPYQIPELPLSFDLEDKEVLTKTKEASRALAELKGVAVSMPNQKILINTLSLQEAKDSSAIENIVTTHDELYQSDPLMQQFPSHAAKEVCMYASALINGFNSVLKNGLVTNNLIITIQAELEGNTAGFRTQAGTKLMNDQTGEIIYLPPQDPELIHAHMKNLEAYINDQEMSDWDPLVKMAVIHHQFESIHPFFDGNGRAGRILNILYLVKEGLLNTPILYLSRYINHNKSEYYRLLQGVRDEGLWKEWVLFMLEGVRLTSVQTINLITDLKDLMMAYKQKMKGETSFYSHDLLNTLFSHPYTKIDIVETQLDVHRNTATKYLNKLENIGLLDKHKMGRYMYYLNPPLIKLLLHAGDRSEHSNSSASS